MGFKLLLTPEQRERMERGEPTGPVALAKPESAPKEITPPEKPEEEEDALQEAIQTLADMREIMPDDKELLTILEKRVEIARQNDERVQRVMKYAILSLAYEDIEMAREMDREWREFRRRQGRDVIDIGYWPEPGEKKPGAIKDWDRTYNMKAAQKLFLDARKEKKKS